MAGLSKWNIVQAYVGGLAGIAVLVTHGSVVMFALVSCLAFVVPIGPNLHRLWPYLGIDRKLDVRFWKAIVKGGFPFFVLAALLVVYGTIDVPLLQVMTGSAEVGWYALGVPVGERARVLRRRRLHRVLPRSSAEGVQLNPAFGSLANRAIRIAVLVATPAAIGIAMIASPFITLLYRGDFQQAIPLLQILALHIPIVSLDIILGSVAMASDRQRQWVIVSIIATLFNPLLNLVAIPASQHAFHNGAIGAAVVTVLTELILMVGGIALRPEGRARSAHGQRAGAHHAGQPHDRAGRAGPGLDPAPRAGARRGAGLRRRLPRPPGDHRRRGAGPDGWRAQPLRPPRRPPPGRSSWRWPRSVWATSGPAATTRIRGRHPAPKPGARPGTTTLPTATSNSNSNSNSNGAGLPVLNGHDAAARAERPWHRARAERA